MQHLEHKRMTPLNTCKQNSKEILVRGLMYHRLHPGVPTEEWLEWGETEAYEEEGTGQGTGDV